MVELTVRVTALLIRLPWVAVPTGISDPLILALKSTPDSVIVNVLPLRVKALVVPAFPPAPPLAATVVTEVTLPYVSTVTTGM